MIEHVYTSILLPTHLETSILHPQNPIHDREHICKQTCHPPISKVTFCTLFHMEIINDDSSCADKHTFTHPRFDSLIKGPSAITNEVTLNQWAKPKKNLNLRYSSIITFPNQWDTQYLIFELCLFLRIILSCYVICICIFSNTKVSKHKCELNWSIFMQADITKKQ